MCSKWEPNERRPGSDHPNPWGHSQTPSPPHSFALLALACSSTDDVGDGTPPITPGGRPMEPYGRDMGTRVPKFFDRAALAVANAVAFLVGFTMRGPRRVQ
jgi:hypothetical protein